MITRKALKAEFEGLLSLKSLVDVYEEVAANRMQRVRGAVLISRQFLDELMGVFARIKKAYRRGSSYSALARNGKTVAVFVSANAGLYGDIVDRIFAKFSEFVRQNNPDVVVIGKLGVKLMADRGLNVLYNYFDFSDEAVETESFTMVMRYLMQFEKIVVFYGRFRSILAQDPETTMVSGDSLESYSGSAQKEVDYLFEPSAREIAKVFEGQILASIFEQTLHESQLAKFASRMLSLDRALDNIDGRLGEMRSAERRLKHKLVNKKQLARLSGVELWGSRL